VSRFFCCAILAFICTQALDAEDIETLKHEVFKDATITRTEPDGIVTTFSGGIVKIPFTDLSPEFAVRFHYDPVKAKEFASSDVQRQRQIYEQTQEARRIANEKDAKISAKSAAEADAAIQRRAIAGFTLDAKEVGTGDTSYDTWKTDYGSYDRQIMQNKRIAISVHDVGGSTANCIVDVYFVGKSLTENVRFVYAHQTITLRVNGGMETPTLIAAPQLDSRILNLAALGEQFVAGAQMEGWFAIGRIGMQRFGLRASNGVVSDDVDRLINEFEARERASKEKR
jgi:hypothetical protein